MPWDLCFTHLEKLYFNNQIKVIIQPCYQTDSASFTLHATRLQTWLGDQTTSSIPILDRHIRYLDNNLNMRYKSAISKEFKSDLAAAIFLTYFYGLDGFALSKHIKSIDVTYNLWSLRTLSLKIIQKILNIWVSILH